MIVDTTFLIDLEREVSRRQPGPAMEFLARNHAQAMRISVITFGELAEGYENPAAAGATTTSGSERPRSSWASRW
jgi:predicted nucleic acid-binding protein